MIVLILLGILLVSPLVLAQEQAQTYSGFGRFIDNIKLTFSGGDNKVRLALNIREKEVNSAMVNTKNGEDEDAGKNLENAWKKLQVVQEKVSINTAEQVKENSDEVRENIMNQMDLPNDFEVYVLEEEKTGLTAEWVVEKSMGEEGKEGQTLGREVEVLYEVDGEIVVKIENRINEIDKEIAEWVVEHTYAEGTTAGGESGVVVKGGLTRVVKTEIANGDNGLKPEVKTYIDVVKSEMAIDVDKIDPDATQKSSTQNIVDDGPCKEGEENCNNDVAPGPDGIVGVQGATNNIDESPGGIDSSYAEGTTAEGDSGDSSDSGSESSGESGGDSGGDSDGDSGMTGEVIKYSNSENIFKKFFNRFF